MKYWPIITVRSYHANSASPVPLSPIPGATNGGVRVYTHTTEYIKSNQQKTSRHKAVQPVNWVRRFKIPLTRTKTVPRQLGKGTEHVNIHIICSRCCNLTIKKNPKLIDRTDVTKIQPTESTACRSPDVASPGLPATHTANG